MAPHAQRKNGLHKIASDMAKHLTQVYTRSWDAFYRKHLKFNQRPLWSVAPEESIGRDWDELTKMKSNGLPIYDLGCGFGEEAVYLAQHFSQIYASDVSASVIERAKELNTLGNLSFVVSDIAAEGEGRRLKALWGAVNVYVRAVLHQLSDSDQTRAIHNIADLLRGSQSICVMTEVAPDIRDYFEQKSGAFSKMPQELRTAFISNLPPRGIAPSRFESLLKSVPARDVRIMPTHLKTRLTFSDGTPVEIPATRAIFSV